MMSMKTLRLAVATLLASVTLLAQGTVMPTPIFQALDDDGNPVGSGKLCVYTAGTSTPTTTYSDVGLAVPNTNPVQLDGAGRAPVYLSPGSSYKFILRTLGSSALECTTGTVVWTKDYVAAVPSSVTSTSTIAQDFRLTLTTNVPVTTADVTAASTIYASPIGSQQIDLPDASGNPQRVTSSQFSIAVPATTSTVYDIYAYYSSGAAALELTAWTNATTRATALTRSNGRLTKTGDPTRLYMGSFSTTAVSGQTEDSLTKRYLWNYYHRKQRLLRRIESTGSWPYTLQTWRQANGAVANQVEAVIGVAEDPVWISLHASAGNGTGTNIGIAISMDTVSISSPTVNQIGGYGNTTAVTNTSLSAVFSDFVAVGRHYFAWMEISGATGTTSWYGAASPMGISSNPSGIIGWIQG